jgi:hypothetical protein
MQDLTTYLQVRPILAQLLRCVRFVMQACMFVLQMIWSAPVQIALSLYFLWAQIGVSVMAGVAVMIVFIPFQASCSLFKCSFLL